MHQPTLPFFQIYPKWMHHIYLRYYKDDIFYWIYYCSDYYNNIQFQSKKNIFTKNIIDSCVLWRRWMKYPIFVLLCSEFAKIKLQTIVGCLKFISCENWALRIVNFVKPAEMLKTLSGNSGISDMDSFCFVYNFKYSKLHRYIPFLYFIFCKYTNSHMSNMWKEKLHLKNTTCFWSLL